MDRPAAPIAIAAWFVAAALTGCAVGPDYVRPSAPVAPSFKEMPDGWKTAQPHDDLPKGRWWRIYGIAELDALEPQVDVSNQNVAQAAAQYRAARAVVATARANFFPTIGASAAAARSRAIPAGSSVPVTGTTHTIAIDAAWEPDLWGGVRRSVESSTAGAQASAADLENMRLSMQAELAQDYFQLRALDAQHEVLQHAVDDDRKSLDLTRDRYQWGVAARSDVVQAQAQLSAAQAQLTDVGIQRAQFEHAMAMLIGKTPAEFSLPPQPLHAVPPDTPMVLPSQLLERRPDIAAAERRVAAANAQIGVAQAAYFPALSLSATASTAFASSLSGAPLLWSLGSGLAQTIFDGGARAGRKAQAIATYEAQVGAYRQTVLGAFQEVEDQLATVRGLVDEARQQDEAVASAREAVQLAINQYKEGTASYLNVLTAQQTALADEQAAVNVAARRFVASVALVKAVGGGWTSADLPDAKSLADSGASR